MCLLLTEHMRINNYQILIFHLVIILGIYLMKGFFMFFFIWYTWQCLTTPTIGPRLEVVCFCGWCKCVCTSVRVCFRVCLCSSVPQRGSLWQPAVMRKTCCCHGKQRCVCRGEAAAASCVCVAVRQCLVWNKDPPFIVHPAFSAQASTSLSLLRTHTHTHS